MSAKLQTFFELKKVIDHDCGNYQIGEIDFVDYSTIREHIFRYGEMAYQDLVNVCIRMLIEAREQIEIVRSSKAAEALCLDEKYCQITGIDMENT